MADDSAETDETYEADESSRLGSNNKVKGCMQQWHESHLKRQQQDDWLT